MLHAPPSLLVGFEEAPKLTVALVHRYFPDLLDDDDTLHRLALSAALLLILSISLPAAAPPLPLLGAEPPAVKVAEDFSVSN